MDTRRLRLLIVTQYFWPESFRINDLAVALLDRGHQVTVLTGMPNYPGGRLFDGYGPFTPAAETFQGVRVLRVPLVPRGVDQRWRLPVNYLSFALCASLLGPLRCRGSFDLVFVYEPSPITVAVPALLLGSMKRAPVMLWVQDLWPDSLAATGAVRSRRLLAMIARLVHFIYRRCDRILVQSRGFVPRVLAAGADPQKVVYLPNWAESFYRYVSVEAEAPERQELPKGFRILFAGNIGAAQSFETILEAAHRLRACPDIHWVVLGDGHKRPWLETEVRARKLDSCVHVLGPRPVDSMPRYLSLADVLLVTLRRDPAFALTVPTKVQSYLACGRPLLAALDGEGARIVEEAQAGLTVTAEDPGALADAVLRLQRLTPEERAAMGRRGRAYFEAHFERNSLVAMLDQLMGEVRLELACAS